MKACDAVIAWTAPESSRHTKGMVEVREKATNGHDAWSEAYSCTGGASWVFWRKLNAEQGLARVLEEFNRLVIQYGLSPQIVHEAFLAIDEYADFHERR